MKTVLLAGGAGFIGSHLCDFFLKKDYRVICVDNFLTGLKENVKGFLKDERFILIEHDISTPLEIKDKLEMVLHFASPASPVDYLAYPIHTLKAGSMGTFHCLELAKLKKARFLLASTSEIYGDPLVHPQKEDYWGNVNSIGPRGVYDESKRFAESATMAYHRAYQLDTKIVRIFNTYGPRMRLVDGRAIPNFITQALRNTPITIYGDGSQTRSFCYVDDLTDGIYRLTQSQVHDPVNLGNPNEMSVRGLAEEILKLTASSSPLILRPLPTDDPKKRCPDITRAQDILKWQPCTGLKDGLSVTIEWFKTKFKAQNLK